METNKKMTLKDLIDTAIAACIKCVDPDGKWNQDKAAQIADMLHNDIQKAITAMQDRMLSQQAVNKRDFLISFVLEAIKADGTPKNDDNAVALVERAEACFNKLMELSQKAD